MPAPPSEFPTGQGLFGPFWPHVVNMFSFSVRSVPLTCS